METYPTPDHGFPSKILLISCSISCGTASNIISELTDSFKKYQSMVLSVDFRGSCPAYPIHHIRCTGMIANNLVMNRNVPNSSHGIRSEVLTEPLPDLNFELPVTKRGIWPKCRLWSKNLMRGMYQRRG